MPNLSKKEIKKGIKDSLKDAAAHSGSTGFKDTYLIPFSLSLGANNVEVGLLNSIPRMLNILIQPVASGVTERIGKRKMLAVRLSFIGKLLWIPVMLLPFFLSNQVFWLIFFVSLISMTASAAHIPWVSWMADFIPEKIRGSYFGKRNAIASAGSFVAILAAGWILGVMNTILGFVVVFSIGTVFALISVYYLSKVPEPEYKICKHKSKRISLGMSEFFSSVRRYKNFSNFAAFIAFMNFSVWIAAPFFVVYMFENLKIGYFWFAVIAGLGAVSNLFFNHYWGKLSDRLGDKAVLSVCSILVVFYPFFFLFVRNPFDLILVEIFSGFAWSGFDLMAFNFLLDTSPSRKRSAYIANFNLFTGIPVVVGPLIGGLFAQYFFDKSLLLISGLGILFFLSFVLRAIPVAMFIPKLKEERVKLSREVSLRNIFFKSITVYPAKSILHDLSFAHHCMTCWEEKLLRKTGDGFKKFIDVTEI